MSNQGFVVTVEGCPVSFGTAGLASVISSDANWPANVTLITDILDTPNITWSETQKPLDGKIDVGGITVTLRDRISDGSVSAIPAGNYYLAWLTTRKSISSTNLSQLMLSTDMVAHCNDASRLAAAPCVIWIDQEAMLVSSFTGNDANVLTRGFYGTAIVAHNFNDDTNDRPAVFAEFPGFDRQRVILWQVDSAAVATVLWIGYCGNTPAMIPGNEFRQFKLQAEHFTRGDAMLPAGPPQATCRLRGVNMSVVSIGIKTSGIAAPWWDRPPGGFAYNLGTIFATLGEALGVAASNAAIAPGAVGTMNGRWTNVTGAGASASVITTGASNVELHLSIGSTDTVATTTDGADPRKTTAVLSKAPSVLVAVRLSDVTAIPVDRIEGMPTTWPSTHTTEPDGSLTTTQSVLLGEVSDEDYVVLYPTTSTLSDTSLSTGGPSVSGTVVIRARKPYAHVGQYYVSARSFVFICIEKPLLLRITALVKSSHWIYALQRGCVEDVGAAVGANLDSRQYDFSDADRVVSLTSDAISAREFYLDGSRTWGDLLSANCKLGGCAPGIRNGRQTIVPFQPPLPTDVVAGTINCSGPTSNLVDGSVPEFGTFEDGIANAVHFKSEAIDLLVQDGQSVSRYRQAKSRDIDLTNSIPAGSSPDEPITISQLIMRRYIGVWGHPNRFIKLKLGPSWNKRFAHGDYVQLNSVFNVPDGLGGYGFTGVGQVFHRQVSTKKDANVEYGFVLFTADRIAGYSPCIRVDSISTATIVVANVYVAGPVTDYAGSNLAGYPGIALDGGVIRFVAGDRVQMVERDTTTPLLEALTILSINYGTDHITFTTTPNAAWAAKIAAGMVDVRFDHYSVASAQADQKPWGWVGAESPAVIDSTSDYNQKFSP